MCSFFSFVTEPEHHGGKRFYFDWEYRKKHLKENDADSHDHIIHCFKLKDEQCNRYEYNPLTKKFVVDRAESPTDDSIQSQAWVENLDFKKVVKPLIIKPIVNPLKIRKQKVTPEIIALLKELASVRGSVGGSVWGSVGGSVGCSVGASVWGSVEGSVWASVGGSVEGSVGGSVWGSVWASARGSVGASVWAYTSSFFDIKYKLDFSSAIKLWEMGIVPSFDGITWRLHSGKKASVIYEISDKELKEKK
jgi:hypothetical protein